MSFAPTRHHIYGHLLTDDASAERDAPSAIRAAAVESREESAKVVPLRVVDDGWGVLGARWARMERVRAFPLVTPWAMRDSNPRPLPCEGSALTN